MAAQEKPIAKDMEKAQSTYDRFMASLKWAIPLIAFLVFVVVLLIAP